MDLGTTFVAAARSAGSQVEMITLGDRSVVMPSAVFIGEDGDTLVGEAAERRVASSPERVARHFKRRLGDPTPLRLGQVSYAATDLLAVLLREVVDRVTATEGEPPGRVVLTHPANWGPYRRGIFEAVPRAAELSDVRTLSEPEAAALHYAATRRLGDGETVAVYDLGGGTFDATVVRKTPDGVATLGTPEGVERLGGIDFDQAVFEFVNHHCDGVLDELDMGDAKTVIALARLRQDCVLAKESLSVDTETVVPVFLPGPGRQFEVRITRAEFEDLIRARIESTITALARTLRSAQVRADELNAVLLVGGCSRIPLVAQMVSEELGRPILVDTHPKYAVALGAATLTTQPAARQTAAPTAAPGVAPPSHSVRSILLRVGAAAVLVAGAAGLTWTLASLPGTPFTTPTPPGANPPGAAAPPLPAILPPPRHIVLPKAKKILASPGESIFAVLNGNSLSALDAATLAPRWTVTVPNVDHLEDLGDEQVGACVGEPRLMTECTPVNLTTGTVEPTTNCPARCMRSVPSTVDSG